MKARTALRQSQVSLKVLSIVLVVSIVLAFRYPSSYTLIWLAVVAVYWALDAYNIRQKKRQGIR
jgi:hypothetical protein